MKVQGENATCMLVAISKPADDSYFIKWTGKKANLMKEKDNFKDFCSSLVYQ